MDMLVFIGQPLPVFKDGDEVVPAVKEEDSYKAEETPFIQVKLREHDGTCSSRPFDATPRQQVSHSSPISDEHEISLKGHLSGQTIEL